MPRSVAITQENCWRVSGLEPEPTPAGAASYNTASNGGDQGSFDMEEYARRHGLRIKSIGKHGGATKYVLEECPFDSSHRGKDVALFLYPDGGRGFKCWHNSCSSYKWRDLRQKLEPGCYDKAFKANGQAKGTADVRRPDEEMDPPLSLAELKRDFPRLPDAVIHGLLRKGETMNVIAAPKVGKSWGTYEIALCVVTGKRLWNTFGTVPGDVLILDNELFPEVSAFRLPLVAKALGIDPEECDEKLFVSNLRGQGRDIDGIGRYLDRFVTKGQYRLIIIDAFYRILPIGTDENNNAAITAIYNKIDHYARKLNCAIAMVHHSSKGSQSGKAVTDVGAGAGSQSRAADTHLILRPHEEPGVVVLEAAVRSWQPVEPICLKWEFPLWKLAEGLDTAALKADKPKITINQLADRVFACLKEHGPNTRTTLKSKLHVSGERINDAVEVLLERKEIEPVDVKTKSGVRTGYQVTLVTPAKEAEQATQVTPTEEVEQRQDKVGLSYLLS